MTQLLIVICLEAIYFEECVFRRAYNRPVDTREQFGSDYTDALPRHVFQDANQSLEYFEHPFPVLED